MNKILTGDLKKLIEKYKNQSKEIQEFILNPVCILSKKDLLKQNEAEKKILKKYKCSSELELCHFRMDLDNSISQLNMFLEDKVYNYE